MGEPDHDGKAGRFPPTRQGIHLKTSVIYGKGRKGRKEIQQTDSFGEAAVTNSTHNLPRRNE